MGFIAGAEQRGTAADMFRRVYWDTALAGSDSVLHMLRDVAGINQVLFGTDFPYLRRDLAVRAKERILQSATISNGSSNAWATSRPLRLASSSLRSEPAA